MPILVLVSRSERFFSNLQLSAPLFWIIRSRTDEWCSQLHWGTLYTIHIQQTAQPRNCCLALISLNYVLYLFIKTNDIQCLQYIMVMWTRSVH